MIDQYKIFKDEKSKIVFDPNQTDSPKRLVGLVGKVTRVSIESARIIRSFPEWDERA
jgi:predicted helicase